MNQAIQAQPEMAGKPGFDNIGMPLGNQEVTKEEIIQEPAVKEIVPEPLREYGRKMFWRLVSRSLDKHGILTTVHGSEISEVGCIIKTVHVYPDGSMVVDSFLAPGCKMLVYSQEDPGNPGQKINYFDLVQPDAVDMNAGRWS